MKCFLKKIIQSTCGASLVELAMIMPVMLLMIVGALDMGSMFVRKMEIANSVKAGIQYALVRKPVQGDVSKISGAVTNSLGNTITETTAIVVELYCICAGVKQVCTLVCTDENVRAFVNITVTEDFKTPFFNYDWFMASFPIDESATIQLN